MIPTTSLALAIWCLLVNSGAAFFKGGGSHRPNGVVVDPGLSIFPTTGRIHTGPVLIKNVKMAGFASIPGGHGGGGSNGGGGGFGSGIADGIMNGLSDKMEGAIQLGTNAVEGITHEFGNKLDNKLKSIQDTLEPIKEELGQLVGGAGLGRGGNGVGGGGGGGNGGGKLGMFAGIADGLINEVQNKLGGILGSLNGGGPIPMNEGHRMVYFARVRNNRRPSHPPRFGKSSNHNRPIAGNGGDGAGGPKWVPSQCPDVYVGVGFSPDPCPGQPLPPCGEDGCNQQSISSTGGWA